MGGKNGTKKYGRNEADCTKYANEGRRAKNKAVKLARHLRKVPWDGVARAAFLALPELAKRGNVIPAPTPKPATGIWRKASVQDIAA